MKGENTFLDLANKIDLIKGREHRQLRFYEDVTTSFSTSIEKQANAIVVTHLLPDVLEYLRAIESVANIVAILPKQKSKDKEVEKVIKNRYGKRVIDPVDRESFSNAEGMKALLEQFDGRIVLFDIGGWFAKASTDPNIRDHVIGIIEDTENGHQKYEEVRSSLQVPVFSVARSPLKENEDFLVGQSILFSADAILRKQSKLIQYMTCGILGYGKIGQSIAHHLLIRGIKPKVFDKKPHLRIAACNAQCEILEREAIIKKSDIIFCATGQKALNIFDFRLLKKGCFIFSVTSSDDEFNLSFLDKEYRNCEIKKHVYQYSNTSNHFFFVNKGNAVNFIHNAVLDDFIHLVRAEMLKAYECILANELDPNIYMLDENTRSGIAITWLKHIRDLGHPEEYCKSQDGPHAKPTP